MNRYQLLAVLFLFGLGSSAAAETVVLSHYPSQSQVKKMMKDGVSHVIIRSRYNQPQVLLGYPSSSHVDSLNRFENVSVDVQIDVSAYPSSAVQSRMSDLESHVSLSIEIRNCLSSDSEARRLMGIERRADVTVYCHTDSSFRDANDLANLIMQRSPQLTVRVFRDQGLVNLQ